MSKTTTKFVAGAALTGLGVITGNPALTRAGALLLLNGVSSKLAKQQVRAETSVEYTGTLEPRRIIYGTLKVSGMHVIPPLTTGTSNKMLHSVLAIAGHEINAVTAVYFNQDTLGTRTAIAGNADDGKVTTGAYANKAWVRAYLGTSSQTADYILNTALTVWTSDHRGRGVAYLACQEEYDEGVYKSGQTQKSCLVQGKKCYDPRLDTSPGADPTNSAYIAFTSNSALCLADYLTDDTLGLGEEATRIDWDMVETAADICDETVAVPTATTQTRYTCNLALLATTSYEDNIAALAQTMLGYCVYSGGKWRMAAGAWEAASFEITDDNVMGTFDVLTAYPYKDRWNGVRGSFVDTNNNYQPTEFPAVQNATHVSDDGESVFKDMDMPGCVNVYEAQRAAILIQRKSRNRLAISSPCDMSLWKVRPGMTGIMNITELSFVNKTVRSEGWRFTPQGLVSLQLREELASDWDDPVEGDYLSPLTITNPPPVYFTPEAPSALAAVNTPKGPSLSWTAPALVPTGAKYALYEYTSSTPFASATKIWEGFATTAVIPKTDQTVRYYWVRVEMPDGTAGAVHPTTTGVSGGGTLVVDTHVSTTAADGSQAYSAGTAPVLEGFGLDSNATYTSPAGEATQVLASWSVQGQISNTTSGAAVGRAYLRANVIVNGSTVWSKELIIEGNLTSTDGWGTLAGSRVFSVPAGQVITVYLNSYRTFSTSGAFPAQTMYWKAASIDLLPTKG